MTHSLALDRAPGVQSKRGRKDHKDWGGCQEMMGKTTKRADPRWCELTDSGLTAEKPAGRKGRMGELGLVCKMKSKFF